MMKSELIAVVINGMLDVLDEDQIRKLKECMYIAFAGVEVEKKQTEIIPCDNSDMLLLKKFIESKVASGKSLKTAKMYYSQIKLALVDIGKCITEINEDDIRVFLYRYQLQRKNSSTTVKNMRAYLSSFFGWLRKNRYIRENPIDLVEPIKEDYTIKEPYKDEEIVRLKDAAENQRDRAIIDFLDASLIRIGELQGLDRNDVVFTERECIVFGKGKKERTAYFNGEAKVHLQEYLESRKDSNPALFVTLGKQAKRLEIPSIQDILRRIGKRAGVNKVHAHRFRRTGATRCLSAGMPVEELQVIMGHTDIKTTLLYAKIDQRKVKFKYNAICSW